MSKGKYSPRLPNRNKGYDFFDRNCFGNPPVPYNVDIDTYDEQIHFANYDPEGFDSYGYSAFDADGNFVGVGNGVDRLGYTEYNYMCMSDDYFNDL